MPNSLASEIQLLRRAYKAFNTRELDTAIALMTSDIRWPRAFKGGFVCGPEEVRAYWIEQGSEINANVEPVDFYQKEDGQVFVKVHQTIRDMAGAVLADEHVGHCYTIENGLIKSMEICPLPSSSASA